MGDKGVDAARLVMAASLGVVGLINMAEVRLEALFVRGRLALGRLILAMGVRFGSLAKLERGGVMDIMVVVLLPFSDLRLALTSLMGGGDTISSDRSSSTATVSLDAL
jgi:hypothetical protein